MDNLLRKRHFILITVFLFIFFLSFSPLLNAQDEPAPPQESVSKVLTLYKTKGEPLAVNDFKQAQEYINLFGRMLEDLAYDLRNLSENERKTLSRAYGDYGVSLEEHERVTSQEDTLKVEKMYMKSIELDNKNIDSLMNIGALYFYLGNYKDAAEYFKLANDIDPSSGAGSLRDLSIQKMKEQ